MARAGRSATRRQRPSEYALLPELHVKLYTAQTVQDVVCDARLSELHHPVAHNREIGVSRQRDRGGKPLFRDLDLRGSRDIPPPRRQLICKARL